MQNFVESRRKEEQVIELDRRFTFGDEHLDKRMARRMRLDTYRRTRGRLTSTSSRAKIETSYRHSVLLLYNYMLNDAKSTSGTLLYQGNIVFLRSGRFGARGGFHVRYSGLVTWPNNHHQSSRPLGYDILVASDRTDTDRDNLHVPSSLRWKIYKLMP